MPLRCGVGFFGKSVSPGFRCVREVFLALFPFILEVSIWSKSVFCPLVCHMLLFARIISLIANSPTLRLENPFLGSVAGALELIRHMT